MDYYIVYIDNTPKYATQEISVAEYLVSINQQKTHSYSYYSHDDPFFRKVTTKLPEINERDYRKFLEKKIQDTKESVQATEKQKEAKEKELQSLSMLLKEL